MNVFVPLLLKLAPYVGGWLLNKIYGWLCKRLVQHDAKIDELRSKGERLEIAIQEIASRLQFPK